MRNDPGAHPIFYRIGFNLYRFSPKLWDIGGNIINIPERIARASDRKAKADRENFISNRITMVNLEMTVICNLRCTMCWWWGENGIVFDMIKNKDDMVTKELTTQETFDVIDQAIKMGAKSFYLSGGGSHSSGRTA